MYIAFVGKTLLGRLSQALAIVAQIGLISFAIIVIVNYFMPRSEVFR